MKLSSIVFGMVLFLFIPMTLHAHVDPAIVMADNFTLLIAQKKKAVMQPLLSAANNCVSRVVNADPRLGKEDITHLIVDSFKFCRTPMRKMIEAHDFYYGEGTGGKFFMGRYLDALPATVMSNLKKGGADAPASH